MRDESCLDWMLDQGSLSTNEHVWFGGSVLDPIFASQDGLSECSDGESSKRTSVRSVNVQMVSPVPVDPLVRNEEKDGPRRKAKVANKKIVSRQDKGRVSKLRAEGKITPLSKEIAGAWQQPNADGKR